VNKTHDHNIMLPAKDITASDIAATDIADKNIGAKNIATTTMEIGPGRGLEKTFRHQE
jgi:hypothetical protein